MDTLRLPSMVQIVKITQIERQLGVRFTGKTYDAASNFIESYTEAYEDSLKLEQEQAKELSDSMRREIEGDNG